MGQERRRFQRAPESFPIQCRNPKEGERWKGVQAINISASGLRLLSDVPFEEHAMMEFKLDLPNIGGPLVLLGDIVWSKVMTVGVVEVAVEFKQVTPEQEIQIDEIVDFMMRKPKPPPQHEDPPS